MEVNLYFKVNKIRINIMNNRIIVGLGNIGSSYDFTRHNVGFLFLDKILEYFEVTDNFQKSQHSMVVNKKIDDVNVYFIKPTTYMNNSGLAVSYWKNWLKIDNSDIMILVDDLHINIGDIRYRKKGSSGGHNGLKNIEQMIGDDYQRLRIGIGNDYQYGQQCDFVIGKFKKEELDIFENKYNYVFEIIENFIKIDDLKFRENKINNILSKINN